MRTDRTALCPACCLRFPAASRCPRCQGDEVFDLSRGASRRRALDALARPPRRESPALESRILATLGLLDLAAMYAVGRALVGRHVGLGEATFIAILCGATLLAMLPLFVGLVFLLVEALDALGRLAGLGRRTPPRVLPTDEQDLLPGPRPSRVSGVVRATQPFASPLSHRACVAARLVGEGPLGPVDDVCAVPFDLVTDEGERIRVSPARASVDLEVTETPQAVRADRHLLAFLTERGVFPRKGPVALAEALLVEGERVVVDGYLGAPRPDRGGAGRYRDDATIRELSARGGVPLVIRRSLRGDAPARAR